MSSNQNLVERYNYDEFRVPKFTEFMSFSSSPELGAKAPDFPLWSLDNEETSLLAIAKQNLLTVVEFGSFT